MTIIEPGPFLPPKEDQGHFCGVGQLIIMEK